MDNNAATERKILTRPEIVKGVNRLITRTKPDAAHLLLLEMLAGDGGNGLLETARTIFTTLKG